MPDRLAGGAIVEIRTATGPDVWAAVECQVIEASASWGTGRSLGVLSQAEGGTIELTLYDPDRLLDPVNRAGPFFALLRPGLWVRLSYSDGVTTTLIRIGRVDSIVHDEREHTGRLRAHDFIGFLSAWQIDNPLIAAPAAVFHLHELATQLIGIVNSGAPAYGVPPPIPVTVETSHGPDLGVGGVPVVKIHSIPIPSGTGPTIWAHLTAAAQSQLYYAYIGPDGVLHFRDALVADLPGVTLGTGGICGVLGFVGHVDADGIVNYVDSPYANSSGGVTQGIEWDNASVFEHGLKSFTCARIVPYGSLRTFPHGNWYQEILFDRKQPSLEALPLEIWPETPAELRALIGVEGMDKVTMLLDVPSPAVALVGRAIGGVIGVTAEGWRAELVTRLVPADQPALMEDV